MSTNAMSLNFLISKSHFLPMRTFITDAVADCFVRKVIVVCKVFIINDLASLCLQAAFFRIWLANPARPCLGVCWGELIVRMEDGVLICG